MDYRRLGSRVREARKDKGYTQNELAELTGYSIQHISHVETGKTKLSVDFLVALANELEISTDRLLMDSLEQERDDALAVTLEVHSAAEKELILDVARAIQNALKEQG